MLRKYRHQVDPVPQHGHHSGAEHHAAPPEAHQQPVTRIPGSEGLLGEEHLRWNRRVDRQYGEEGPDDYRQRYARTEEVAEPGPQVAHEAASSSLSRRGRGSGTVERRIAETRYVTASAREGGVDPDTRDQQAPKGRTDHYGGAERASDEGVCASRSPHRPRSGRRAGPWG